MKSYFLFFVFFLSVFNHLFPKKIKIPRNLRQGFHFECLKDKKTRVDDYPILSAETYRAHSDFILDETIQVINTDDLFDGCVIFVGLRSLKDFYYKVLPYINNKVVVVTHNGEPFHLNERLTWDTYVKSPKYLTPKFVAHPNILAFFGKNVLYKSPKCLPIPLGKHIGMQEHTPVIKASAPQLNKGSFFKEKKIYIYINVNLATHKDRVPIFKHWRDFKGVVISQPKPFPAYFNDMQNSKFVLSPRGYGIDCIRTWEALYAGSIPVVESLGMDSIYEDLPVIIVKDLTKVTLEDLESEYEKLKLKDLKLDRLFADYWINKFHSYKCNY